MTHHVECVAILEPIREMSDLRIQTVGVVCVTGDVLTRVAYVLTCRHSC